VQNKKHFEHILIQAKRKVSILENTATIINATWRTAGIEFQISALQTTKSLVLSMGVNHGGDGGDASPQNLERGGR